LAVSTGRGVPHARPHADCRASLLYPGQVHAGEAAASPLPARAGRQGCRHSPCCSRRLDFGAAKGVGPWREEAQATHRTVELGGHVDQAGQQQGGVQPDRARPHERDSRRGRGRPDPHLRAGRDDGRADRRAPPPRADAAVAHRDGVNHNRRAGDGLRYRDKLAQGRVLPGVGARVRVCRLARPPPLGDQGPARALLCAAVVVRHHRLPD